MGIAQSELSSCTAVFSKCACGWQPSCQTAHFIFRVNAGVLKQTNQWEGEQGILCKQATVVEWQGHKGEGEKGNAAI